MTNGAVRYLFQQFTLNSGLLANTNYYSKTFSTLDVSNITVLAVYASQLIQPQIIAASANIANPVGATTNFVMTFRFDRSMATQMCP